MKHELVHVLNTRTGQVGDIRRRLFESKVFNPNGLLVEVPNTQKPYLPEMYRAKPLEASEVAEDAEDEEE
ncbi:MAG: hypothetical protein Tp182DCM212571_50 [Prokaryotic dsDNA virus sp.]|jgi:hypothetical protein|nr:MAG: hypothetical protein Tp182DCM212571_50 [Prokaryotic dsDNA virus sp.]|tara:strand:+ start:75 stop:284 length:210 start_codon:yes stop_codon:yes gene_type:complete